MLVPQKKEYGGRGGRPERQAGMPVLQKRVPRDAAVAGVAVKVK
jgi:hypothetical protein